MNRKTALAALVGCALLTAPVGASNPSLASSSTPPDPIADAALEASAAELALDPVVVPAARTARGWTGSQAGAVAPEQVPTIVLDAYTRAVALAPQSCQITVPLLAAVGQVESGNLVGRQLGADHAVTPAIIGPRLDGGAFKAVRDTDGGRLDGDEKWDRAVGPMQFLPSTWRAVGVDIDGDGKRDPQNIYDAAGAAMVYLCGDRDLSDPEQLRQAILSYNRSTDYLQQVLRWKQTFEEDGLSAVASLPIFSAAATNVSTTSTAAGVPGARGDVPQARPAAKSPAARPGAKPSPDGGTKTGKKDDKKGGADKTPGKPKPKPGPKPQPDPGPTPPTPPTPAEQVRLADTTTFDLVQDCSTPPESTWVEITQDIFDVLVFTQGSAADASGTVEFPEVDGERALFGTGEATAPVSTLCQTPAESPSASPSPSPGE